MSPRKKLRSPAASRQPAKGNKAIQRARRKAGRSGAGLKLHIRIPGPVDPREEVRLPASYRVGSARFEARKSP